MHGVQARFYLVTVPTAQLTGLADIIDRGDRRRRVGFVLAGGGAQGAFCVLEGRIPTERKDRPRRGPSVTTLTKEAGMTTDDAVIIGTGQGALR